MGPHSTCLQCAETCQKRGNFVRGSTPLMYPSLIPTSLVAGHLRFIMFLSSGLLINLGVLLTTVFFIFSFVGMHVFLRFQYKLGIFLVMLGRQQIQFHKLNQFCLYCLHVMMLMLGGFGWLSLLYIEL